MFLMKEGNLVKNCKIKKYRRWWNPRSPFSRWILSLFLFLDWRPTSICKERQVLSKERKADKSNEGLSVVKVLLIPKPTDNSITRVGKKRKNFISSCVHHHLWLLFRSVLSLFESRSLLTERIRWFTGQRLISHHGSLFWLKESCFLCRSSREKT